MKKIIFSKREKQIFRLILIICFIYLIYIVIYIPFQKKSVSLKKEILDMQRELEKNNNIISQSKSFEKRYGGILAEFKQKVQMSRPWLECYLT